MKKLIEKWNAMPASAKSALAFVVSSFILKGISFLTTPIFTRIMDQSQYGVISLYTSWLSIIEVFALLGLTSAGVFNVGLADYRDDRDAYISSTLTLCNMVTVIVFGVVAAAKVVLGSDFLLPNHLMLLMFVHLIFSPAQVFWITRKKYEFEYSKPFIITVGTAVLAQAVSVAVVAWIDADAAGYGKLWATEAVSLCVNIPLYALLFIRGRKAIDIPRWKQILTFALPLIPHYLSQHIMASSDRIMVAELVSEADAGIYSVVANISMVATIVWNAINGSLIAYTFENLREKNYKSINSTACMLLTGYGAVCFSICMIAPEVLGILAPEEYAIGVYAVPPIACVAYATALYNIFANIEFYNKKSKFITIATITAALVNFVLNMIVIPKFSFVGASYTTMISYIVLVVMHYLGYRRSTEDKIYNGKAMLTISLVVIVACEACTLLYESWILRYGILLLVLLAAVWKRKDIMGILASLKK